MKVCLISLLAATSIVIPGVSSAEHLICRPAADHTQMGPIGWVAYRIELTTSGTLCVGALNVTRDSEASATGLWLLDGQGDVRSQWTRVSSSSQPVGFHVRNGESDHRFSYGMQREAGPGMAQMWSLPAGTYYAVIAGAAKGSASITGELWTEGTVAEKVMGDDGFIFHDRDFEGAIGVYAGAPSQTIPGLWLGVPGVSAHFASDVAVETQVESRLFGSFEVGGSLNLQPRVTVGYDGPHGRVEGSARYGFDGSDPGRYRFWVDEASGAPFAGLWAWGADVVLPEP